MHLRPAERSDAPALAQIYNVEVETSTVTFDLVPRTLVEQQRWLDAHLGAFPCLVAVADDEDPEPDGTVLGFASLSPYRERPAYSTTVEDSIYVDRAARGRKVGSTLLDALIAAGRERGFHTIIARITGENGTSVTLHEQAGFTLVGIEREIGRKHGRWLDVIELQLLLD